MPIPITKDSTDTIKQIIVEYETHDREAFATRTEMFKLMMEMALELERIYKNK